MYNRTSISMEVISLAIPDVKFFSPALYADERGYFSEIYNAHTMAEIGIEHPFVQDNQSFSSPKGVLRGLHFQRPPHAQDKLLRVLRGRIFDVAVDIRQGSPTFGQSVTAELSSDNGGTIYVPKGFAHGFLTLQPDTEVFYKVSHRYVPEAEEGIHWLDLDLAIKWPLEKIGGENAVTLTSRDQTFSGLSDLPPYFSYNEGGAAV